jgi:dolichol-phosphate mannosyltransferase
MARSLSIVIPTRNEVENIGPLIEQIVANHVPFQEIVFVDADSTDGTQDAIRSLGRERSVRLIGQDANEPGLAAAIMAGARAATGEWILVMDADLSHPPDRISHLLGPLFADNADLVIGSRYIPGGSTPGWPLWRRTLSRVGSAFAYPITGVRDSMCGFFAIGRQRLLDLNPPTTGFKIAFEIIVRGGRNLRIREIPIAFCDRARGHSKMSLRVAIQFFVRWLAAIFSRTFRR